MGWVCGRPSAEPPPSARSRWLLRSSPSPRRPRRSPPSATARPAATGPPPAATSPTACWRPSTPTAPPSALPRSSSRPPLPRPPSGRRAIWPCTATWPTTTRRHRRAHDRRPARRMRLHRRRLGREHRGRLPDRRRRHAGLARVAGPPREHRAARLPGHRDRRRGCAERRRLLGADVRDVDRRDASASASASASAASAAAPAASAPADHDHDHDHDDDRDEDHDDYDDHDDDARDAGSAACSASRRPAAPRRRRALPGPPRAARRPPLRPALPRLALGERCASRRHVPGARRPRAGLRARGRLRPLRARRAARHAGPAHLGDGRAAGRRPHGPPLVLTARSLTVISPFWGWPGALSVRWKFACGRPTASSGSSPPSLRPPRRRSPCRPRRAPPSASARREATGPPARPALADAVLAAVNAHRATVGARPLAVSPALQAAAVWKARHMAKYGYMSHDDPAPPVARTVSERIAACGYTGGGWGENIAVRLPDRPGRRAGLALLARPPRQHRAAGLRLTGVAAAVAPSGVVYWAQSFGTSTVAPRRRHARPPPMRADAGQARGPGHPARRRPVARSARAPGDRRFTLRFPVVQTRDRQTRHARRRRAAMHASPGRASPSSPRASTAATRSASSSRPRGVRGRHVVGTMRIAAAPGKAQRWFSRLVR